MVPSPRPYEDSSMLLIFQLSGPDVFMVILMDYYFLRDNNGETRKKQGVNYLFLSLYNRMYKITLY
jgi:hypothetical protein